MAMTQNHHKAKSTPTRLPYQDTSQTARTKFAGLETQGDRLCTSQRDAAMTQKLHCNGKVMSVVAAQLNTSDLNGAAMY